MDASKLPKEFRCWPTHWLEAAVESQLAWKSPDGGYFITGGPAQRDRLEKFVELILEKHQPNVEVE